MPRNNPRLFVISGGPGSGKTTVLMELAKLGFKPASEVARQIIQEQMQINGTALPWHDRTAYTRLMLKRSIESYLQHSRIETAMFSDRGIPDTLGYAKLIGLCDHELVEEITDACLEYRYAPIVFLAPPWKEIYETDSERKQDFDEAERTFTQVSEVYRRCGYESILLPKLTSSARAQFILDRLTKVVDVSRPSASNHD